MPRLPQPGSDSGTWGDILNEFLTQSLEANGTLKEDSVGSAQLQTNAVTSNAIAPNSITNTALASDAVNAAIIQDGSITEPLLDVSLQAKINAGGNVSSVAGKTGVVTLTKSDVDLANIDNTSDLDKPISSAMQTALNAKANDSSVVHNSGSETIAGAKTFSNALTASGMNVNTNTSGGSQVVLNNANAAGRVELTFQENGSDKGFFQYRGTTNPAIPNTFRFQTQTGTNTDIILGTNGSSNFFIAGGQNGLTAGNIGVGTTSPEAKLSVAGEVRVHNGSSYSLYNTSDQSTNYERIRTYWSGNTAYLSTEAGGTGTPRNLYVNINNARGLLISANPSVNGRYSMNEATTFTNGVGVSLTNTFNTSSGTNIGLSVSTTLTQSSTAGYTTLRLNATETSTGSGEKLLIDAQVDGSSKFSVNSSGVVQANGSNLISASSTDTLTNKTISGATLAGTTILPQGSNLYSYNTTDQTTNYERVGTYWNSNAFNIFSGAGGTGTPRPIRIISGNATFGINELTQSLVFTRNTPSVITTLFDLNTSGTGLSGTSGVQYGVRISPTINQTSTGGYTMFLVNPTETSTGSGVRLLADFQVGNTSKTRIDNTGTHYLSNGAGIASFNTTDETTNYERARQYWSSNTYTIITESGGTGISRNMQIQAGSTAISLQGSGGVQVFRNNTGINYLLNVTSTGLTASSATQYGLTINPTINQSGTAGYTALLVNPSEAATGSGAKRLVDVQAGGSSKFYIQSDGGVVFQGAGDNAFNIANTITQTAAGAVIGVGVTSNVNPASTSSAEVRAFNMSSQISNAQTHGTVRGGFLETRFMGSGSADTLTGARSQVVLPANSQNFGTITTAMGIEVAGLVESASTALTAGTVTNVVGMRAITNYKSSPGMTVTNVYGIDVQSQTIGSFNVGVRIAKSNTYSLWMSDTGGTAAGGITFGTDTNLYRSAAGVLKSDSKIEVGDYALTTPAFHAKAGASGNPIFQISRGTGTTQQFAWDMNIAGGGFGLRDAVTGYQGLNLYAASNGGAEIYVGQKGSQANYSTMSALLSASTHSAPVGSDVGGPKLTIQGGGGTGVGTPGDIEFKTFSTTAAGANVQSSTVRATIKATTGEMTIANPGTGTGSVVSVDGTQTLTNKRISPRVITVTAGATPAINTDNGDVFIITGLTVAITSMTSGLTGTPVDGQRIRISITGTAARAITWGTSFEASTIALPTTTVSTNRLDTDFIWNAATSKWRVAAEIPGTVYVSGGTDVSVADGGTGRSTSTTAYGIIAAGTTATGAQQTIAPGTAGQFLKSAGTAALGSFANITGADVTALPYDVSFMHTVGTRTVGYGTNTMGTRLPRNCTFTSVTFRCGTADASGNLVVELRKNGVTVTGTSTTVAAASQVSGGTSTGSWSFVAGDILTVYVSGIGTTPGNGLIADITGVTA